MVGIHLYYFVFLQNIWLLASLFSPLVSPKLPLTKNLHWLE